MSEHAHQTGTQSRVMALLLSGPMVLAAALLGLWAGTTWHFGGIPERFQEIYVTIYRTMALPFLALTVLHAIIRLRATAEAGNAVGKRLLVYMPLAMLLSAVTAMAVALAICAYADTAIARGIGPLIAAFDKADANYVEVTLAASETAEPSLLMRLILEFIPENIFKALATANVGQMIVFLIIFAAAITRLSPAASGKFVELVGASRRPFQHLMESMQIFIPIAVFMYAIHAAHAVSAEDLEALKLLFLVVGAACVAVFLLAILLVSILTLVSPLQVAADIKASALTGILAMTEEAALPAMIRRIAAHRQADEEAQEIVASLGLAVGRFGMITVLASVLCYTILLYDIPVNAAVLGSVMLLSVIAAVLISGLNGPGVFAASLAFCGLELGLPVEALVVLVIVMEPLLELLLIPVSVAVTHALVEVVTASLAREKRRSALRAA